MNPYETRVIATVLIATIVCLLAFLLVGCGGGDPKPPEETCGTRPIMCVEAA